MVVVMADPEPDLESEHDEDSEHDEPAEREVQASIKKRKVAVSTVPKYNSAAFDPFSLYEGYNQEWFTDQTTINTIGMICNICLDVPLKPCMTNCCNSIFCLKCLTQAYKDSPSCPKCRKDTRAPREFDFLTRTINNMTVHCPWNHELQHSFQCDDKEELKCAWMGSTMSIQDHSKVCPLVSVTCACGQKMSRKEQVEHQKEICSHRLVPCQLCQDQLVFKDVQKHKCPQVPAECKMCHHMCTAATLQKHVQEICPEAMIPCIYAETGCDTRLPRKDQAEHCQDASAMHAQLFQDWYRTAKDRIQGYGHMEARCSTLMVPFLVDSNMTLNYIKCCVEMGVTQPLEALVESGVPIPKDAATQVFKSNRIDILNLFIRNKWVTARALASGSRNKTAAMVAFVHGGGISDEWDQGQKEDIVKRAETYQSSS